MKTIHFVTFPWVYIKSQETQTGLNNLLQYYWFQFLYRRNVKALYVMVIYFLPKNHFPNKALNQSVVKTLFIPTFSPSSDLFSLGSVLV